VTSRIAAKHTPVRRLRAGAFHFGPLQSLFMSRTLSDRTLSRNRRTGPRLGGTDVLTAAADQEDEVTQRRDTNACDTKCRLEIRETEYLDVGELRPYRVTVTRSCSMSISSVDLQMSYSQPSGNNEGESCKGL
jgi:hypothetical protein